MKEGQLAGLTGKELADFVDARLKGLSAAPVIEAGRKSTSEAFNLGRNIEAQEQAESIKEVIRTEILDFNTCPPCRALDHSNSKAVYVLNSPEYFENMPPNKCNGRERCRGFYLFRRAA